MSQVFTNEGDCNMSEIGGGQRSLTESEWLRAAKYIWPEQETDDHLSNEDLSYYAELSVNWPELLASEETEEISRHLLQCDECLGD